MNRNSYDTSIKHLYRSGLEESIPSTLRNQIPRTNIHRWKNEDDSKYVGMQLNYLAKQELDLLTAFAKAKRAKQLFRASLRISKTLQSILDTKTIEDLLRDKKDEIVNLAERVKEVFPVNSFINLIGISRSTFQNWKQEIKIKCDHSFLFKCNSRFPLQASHKEVLKVKQFLTDPNFIFWPITSIAAFCRREGIVTLSNSTWYKYAKFLEIKRPKPSSRRKKNTIGIRASKPNQIWHADVSILKIDHIKHYIYLVVDNFSRKMLARKVSDQLNASIRVQTIQLAYQNASLIQENLNVKLIVDGGSENNNSIMDRFIENSKINIHKLIALRDIHFSNSLVEAHFSLIKYNYLYRMKINSLHDLDKALEFIEHDFNTIRPHGSLNGATPDEAYATGKLMPKNQFSSQTKRAKEIRILENKNNLCIKCS